MLRKIPNILTVGRILIVPFFVLAFYLPGFYGDLTALILFITASFTDFLDGMLARLMGEESKLGELLDPIADKIIVASALILLVMDGTIRNYEVIAAINISPSLFSKSAFSTLAIVGSVFISAEKESDKISILINKYFILKFTKNHRNKSDVISSSNMKSLFDNFK